MFLKQPFDEFLRFQYERITEDRIVVTLPIQPLYINTVGVVHGGIISTLADVAMCNIVEPGKDGKQQIVTIDINVSYLNGAKGKYLKADASTDKIGKKIIHTRCNIYDEKNELVAKAKGIYFFVHS